MQEEDNLKVVLDDKGEPARVLARENGLARYERIDNYDWGAGDDYWQRTGPFWAVVREAWRDLFRDNARLGVSKEADGMALFMAMFELADSSTEVGFDRETTGIGEDYGSLYYNQGQYSGLIQDAIDETGRPGDPNDLFFFLGPARRENAGALSHQVVPFTRRPAHRRRCPKLSATGSKATRTP